MAASRLCAAAALSLLIFTSSCLGAKGQSGTLRVKSDGMIRHA
jgi:hypothetical protein